MEAPASPAYVPEEEEVELLEATGSEMQPVNLIVEEATEPSVRVFFRQLEEAQGRRHARAEGRMQQLAEILVHMDSVLARYRASLQNQQATIEQLTNRVEELESRENLRRTREREQAAAEGGEEAEDVIQVSSDEEQGGEEEEEEGEEEMFL